MNIPSTSTFSLAQVLQRAAIESRYQTTRQLDRVATAASGEDRLEISADGRDLSRLRGVLQDSAAAVSEVREDKVALARERVATGFYDREEIVAKISDRVLSQSSLQEAARATAPQDVPDTEYRAELMQEVSDKIASGFYSDNEVMRFVADRLINIYDVEPPAGGTA